MHLTRMRLGGVPPFTEPVEFEFDERVNVFVGPNASGKSTVLSEINLVFDEALWRRTSVHRVTDQGKEIAQLVSQSSFNSPYPDDASVASSVASADRRCVEEGHNYVAVNARTDRQRLIVNIGTARIGLAVNSIGDLPNLGETSARELLERDFSGENLRRALEKSWIEVGRRSDMRLARVRVDAAPVTVNPTDRQRSEEARHFLESTNLAYSCAKSICDEVIVGIRPVAYTSRLEIENRANQEMASLDTPYLELGIPTNDELNFSILKPEHRPTGIGAEHLHISSLSSGTQLTLLWIWWLALKMVHHYDFEEGWEKRPAILLIDEIENHLHPTWQRRVIPALLEHFPGLQIFATTHSPFVVAGLKAGQVHMLKRDADETVKATTNKEAIEGWTADEILRVYMGVEHPTDEATAAAARELRGLRDEGVRADEGAEEERQAEILRLRKIVDRVELSGPRVAENERFLTSLDAILERHIQSQSLNQENG